MSLIALVNAEKPVVRVWDSADNPKAYVQFQFKTQADANAAVEQLNSLLKNATDMTFGSD